MIDVDTTRTEIAHLTQEQQQLIAEDEAAEPAITAAGSAVRAAERRAQRAADLLEAGTAQNALRLARQRLGRLESERQARGTRLEAIAKELAAWQQRQTLALTDHTRRPSPTPWSGHPGPAGMTRLDDAEGHFVADVCRAADAALILSLVNERGALLDITPSQSEVKNSS